MIHNSNASTVVFRLVNNIVNKHEVTFGGMVRGLNIETQTGSDRRRTFTRIADEMLADGQMNWGRIVTIFAFSAYIAKQMSASLSVASRPEAVLEICGLLANYADHKLTSQIEKDLGGWVSSSTYIYYLYIYYIILALY